MVAPVRRNPQFGLTGFSLGAIGFTDGLLGGFPRARIFASMMAPL
jgi:hypothetical protein